MAVFGDFLTPASEHIAAAVSVTDLPEPAICGAVHELNRLVATLALYLNDATPPDMLAVTPTGALAAQAPALACAGEAIGRACLVLSRAPVALRNADADRGHPAVRHLSAAADYLAAGRDLLATHFTEGSSGGREPGSYWVPVMTSAPVTSALLAELSTHARRLAPWTLHLSVGASRSHVAAAAYTLLNETAPLLWAAGEGIAAAQRHHPHATDGRRLLAAIPASTAGPRQPPNEAETLAELCQQTVHTCERLRRAAWSFAREARWSPATTSQNWRRDAFASAIVGHSSEIILHALDQRAAQLGVEPGIRGQIRATARAAQRAWDARRVVAGAWDILSTGTPIPAVISPVAAELGDLVLRTGRLAYRNPAWTPARGTGASRPPADLAPSAGDLAAVLAAVHHGLDAIAKIALEDMEAVRTAAIESRIYLPTRNVPPGWRISRRYKPAPRPQIDALLRLYEKVLTADKRALASASHLARTLHAPSELLAEASNSTRMPAFTSAHKGIGRREQTASAPAGDRQSRCPAGAPVTFAPVTHLGTAPGIRVVYTSQTGHSPPSRRR